MTTAEWITEERVPVYDEHILVRRDPATGKLTETPVTEALLHKIANARNAKIDRSGNFAPVKIGHTRFDLPEYAKAKWSPTVGWADKFEVGKADDGRPTMYARLHFRPEETIGGETLTAEQIMTRFPHRSIEAPHDLDILDAVCLLEPGNTPGREMGLLRMAAAADPGVSTSELPMEPQGDECDQLMAAILGAIEQFQASRQGGQQPGPGPGALPAEPAQYSAAAGAGNGAMPELEKVRMQKDQADIRIRQLEEKDKIRETEVGTIKLQYRKSELERRLVQLEAENYAFDRAAELTDLLSMTDDAAERHLSRIKQHYQRNGSSSFIRTADVPAGSHSPHADYPNREKVQAIIKANPGITFDQAKAQALAG